MKLNNSRPQKISIKQRFNGAMNSAMNRWSNRTLDCTLLTDSWMVVFGWYFCCYHRRYFCNTPCFVRAGDQIMNVINSIFSLNWCLICEEISNFLYASFTIVDWVLRNIKVTALQALKKPLEGFRKLRLSNEKEASGGTTWIIIELHQPNL